MHPFWSDDFDTDLLKVFPTIASLLHDPGRVLWTVGHATHGRLNHPSVWNGHGAFLWTEKPELERDKHGWFNVVGCTSNDELVECTWLEWLRDAWVHSYGWIVMPSRSRFPSAPDGAFMDIMYGIRGLDRLVRDRKDAERRALRWVLRCDSKMSAFE